MPTHSAVARHAYRLQFDNRSITLALYLNWDARSQSAFSARFYYQRFAKPLDRNCILGPMIWNTSEVLPVEGFPGILLNALFGYTDRLYLVQAISYCVFLTTVGGIYFQGIKAKGELKIKNEKLTSP